MTVFIIENVWLPLHHRRAVHLEAPPRPAIAALGAACADLVPAPRVATGTVRRALLAHATRSIAIPRGLTPPALRRAGLRATQCVASLPDDGFPRNAQNLGGARMPKTQGVLKLSQTCTNLIDFR